MGRLDAVQDTVFDLLVVGGGINGAGIARDAAMRGLKVCLVDKNDWGWGTSSKSSMLAHGGLRYLEQFELGLVHEALQDRELMFKQAPHLVRPLRFLYPLYPHIASRRTVRVGLMLYDILSHGKSVPNRDYLRRDAVLRLAPGMEPTDLKGGAIYTDGQYTSVERFVTELAWSAKHHGAAILNHTEVTDLVVEPGPDGHGRRCTGARIRTDDGDEATVRARTVVNAGGPWVDDVLGPLGDGRPKKIRKTKGIHVAVPRFLDVALIIKAKDGRMFFILPWQDLCLIGTTDTDYEGDAGDATADAEDVRYLVESARRYFPDAPLDDIRFTYAGVRPLVNQTGLTESNVTRRHILYDHGKREGVERLWSVQGGKLTTYRALAEETVKQVCKTLGRDDLARLRPTREGTLPGGPLVDWETFRPEAVAAAVSDFRIPQNAAEHIVDTYGARWRHVLEADADGLTRITKGHPELWCQVAYAVREEDAHTVEDVMLRRTHLGLAADGRMGTARKVADRMAEPLGWDKGRIEVELDAYRHAVRVLAVPGDKA